LTVEFLSDLLPTGVMVAWSVGDHTINCLTIIFLISMLKIKIPCLQMAEWKLPPIVSTRKQNAATLFAIYSYCLSSDKMLHCLFIVF
jgi:hypothetical protein